MATLNLLCVLDAMLNQSVAQPRDFLEITDEAAVVSAVSDLLEAVVAAIRSDPLSVRSAALNYRASKSVIHRLRKHGGERVSVLTLMCIAGPAGIQYDFRLMVQAMQMGIVPNQGKNHSTERS